MTSISSITKQYAGSLRQPPQKGGDGVLSFLGMGAKPADDKNGKVEAPETVISEPKDGDEATLDTTDAVAEPSLMDKALNAVGFGNKPEAAADGAAPAPEPAPAPAPAPAAAPPAAAPAPPAAAPAPAAPGISNSIPRLLSRYLNNELLRGARQPINQAENTNIFSMLYAVPPEVRPNGTAPTTEQIRQATMNTVFGRITTPVNATCPISRDEFNDDSEVTIIRSCRHIFNRSSLGAWFVSHFTCPMCRSDIREYVPRPATDAAAHLPERRQRPPPPPANLSIDRIDDNEFTFSYDMPVSFNNDQIYQDIVNTVNHITNHRGYNTQRGGDYDDDDGDGDDDIMEVD